MLSSRSSLGRSWRVLLLSACLVLQAGAGSAAVGEASGEHTAAMPDAAQAARLLDAEGPVTLHRQEEPPGWRVERAGEALGFVASTWEVAGSIGYSGQPIDILVAVDPQARIAGAELVFENEPVLTLNVSSADIAAYVSSFDGLDLTRPAVEAFARRDDLPPVIARATVTTGVIRDAILRTARVVALGRGFIETEGRRIDRASYAERSWDELVATGALAHELVTMTDAHAAFAGAERPPAPGDGPFFEVWVGLLDPPTIGRTLLGQQGYSAVIGAAGARDAALFVGSRGVHGHRGLAWRRDGWFDRIEVVQGEQTFRLSADDYMRVQEIAAEGAPDLEDVSVFRLGGASGFRPDEPFRVVVTAGRAGADGGEITFRMPVAYALPEEYLLAPVAPPEPVPLWVEAWEAQPVEIAVTSATLGVLFLILMLQGPFVRRPKLYRLTRLGFLGFTLVGLGWILGGQLSVVQVVAFLQSLLGGFRWETFLIEPVIFLIWSFVAVGLLFLGRGVFCGWLCPFGAAQELLSAGARRIGIPQVALPHALHERLWAIKYVAFIAILGLSFYSMEQALMLAEIEPFKTAMTMRFQRAWPFVLFAVGVLAAGLFIERFYCRYLCPLGAALAIPAKMKLFDWLARRPQCGRECHFCEPNCPTGAIDPIGRISPNECVLCLRCQEIMYNPRECIVLKQRARRRHAAGSAS